MSDNESNNDSIIESEDESFNDSIIELGIEDIEPGANYRKQVTGVEDLAESIKADGLLQNLVVAPIPDSSRYRLIAGQRRFAAICLLHEKGDWKGPIPCLVREADLDNQLLSLIENEVREEVPDWESGARFRELQNAGISVKAIALTIRKPQHHVANCIQLANGLTPEAVKVLQRIGTRLLTKSELLRVSYVTDELGQPAVQPQLAMIHRILSGSEKTSRRGRRPAGELEELKDLIYSRYKTLKRRAEPVCEALCQFLDGRQKQLVLPERYRIGRRQVAKSAACEVVKDELRKRTSDVGDPSPSPHREFD